MVDNLMGAMFLSDSLKLGGKMPSFNLEGVDERRHSSAEYSTKKVLVVVFMANNSKYSESYVRRLIALQEKFLEYGVQIIAINSNDSSNSTYDSLPLMAKQAQKRGFNFPYLKDETQDVARNFDAICNPEAYVFDEDRILRYRGKIDDCWNNPHAVKINYVLRAVKQLLHGKEVTVQETNPSGDTIKWKY